MSFTKTILEGVKYWVENKFSRVEEELVNKQPVGDYALKEEIPEVPVNSVNGKTGDVIIDTFSGSWNDLTDKPFSEETNTSIVTVFDELVTITKPDYTYYGSPSNLENGKVYKIIINGVLEHPYCECRNGYLSYFSEMLNVDIDIYSDHITTSSAIEARIKIETEEVSTTIKQLDEKFIPDTIARKEYVNEAIANLVGDTAVSEQISTAISESVADWNQNDETAADYIKNRTHYDNIVTTSVVLADEEVSLLLLPDVSPEGYWSEPITLENGKTYTVTVNEVDIGTVYKQELVCENDELIFTDAPESGDTLTITDSVIYGSREWSYHIKIETTEVSGTLKQLDEKFIPDTIARVEDIPTTAIKPFPYYEVNLIGTTITQYKVNLEELETDVLYSVQESAPTFMTMFALCIVCDDGTEKIVTNISAKTSAYKVSKTTERIVVYNVFDNNTTTIDISDKSTSSNVVVTSNVISKWLPVNNSVEYTPTDNYHPATKKYVDDSVAVAVHRPTTATVGQTIIVKSVDENGKPTEWEAVDPWVINSSTEGSTKKFKVTIDDTGTLTVSEIVTEEVE